MRVGTAGWSVTKAEAAAFPAEGAHLYRFSRVMDCVEINSSFQRHHRTEVYERWASQTPANFRFSVKLPKDITHTKRLQRARKPLSVFLDEVAGLGDKLGVLLVQLPPSLAFEPRVARTFFGLLRQMHAGPVVCEPRHATWFEGSADSLLQRMQVSRVAADPTSLAEAARPGGWLGQCGDGNGATVYFRWHGSPRRYWSSYGAEWLRARAREMQVWSASADVWAIFDNTAGGAALGNALAFMDAN